MKNKEFLPFKEQIYFEIISKEILNELKKEKKSLSMKDRADIWNNTFEDSTRWPMTVFNKNWLYAVWYCGTTYQKNLYYGQYPPTFLKRLLTLFPDKKIVVHLCSGIVDQDITIDIKRELKPTICADVQNLPFRENVIDLYVGDPPYSRKEAEDNYGTSYPTMNKAMKSALPTLKIGGFFCILDVRYPSYSRKKGWALVGLIAVVTGFSKVTRITSIFRKEF